MDNLFKKLHNILNDKEKFVSSISKDDALFAIGDIPQEMSDIISEFVFEEGEKLLLGDDYEEEEEEDTYTPDISKLAIAAILTLSIRGDIYEQLKKEGYLEEAEEVKNYWTKRRKNLKNKEIIAQS